MDADHAEYRARLEAKGWKLEREDDKHWVYCHPTADVFYVTIPKTKPMKPHYRRMLERFLQED